MANNFIQSQITDAVLADHHPKSWKSAMNLEQTTILDWRNPTHFANTMSLITQEKDHKCGISYADALSELKAGVGTISDSEYQLIKHKVKESLLKRDLISENIYQGFNYSVAGEVLDIALYVEGNPECYLAPKAVGKTYFYELYINTTVNSHVSDETIQQRIAQILATVELLEQERIYIKLNIVTAITGCNYSGKSDLITIVPIFSHRDIKDIGTLSSICNTRFLRKFMFATMEDIYGNSIDIGYGSAKSLPNCINLSESFDEVKTVESILDTLVIPCKSRSK